MENIKFRRKYEYERNYEGSSLFFIFLLLFFFVLILL